MIDILTFMSPAICMCIILVGICVYAGIHVIMREVIFIDIALAQIAAFGATIGLFLGLELTSAWTYVISLIFALLAAALLSGTKRLSDRTPAPQEAFIGILYATGAAAVLLAGDRLAHGSEHVHDLMGGHLLWVTWPEVGWYFLICAILGLVYALSHNRLLEAGKATRTNTRASLLWEFVFYALLGALVTFIVRVAGVLLVFGFLIVPALIGVLLGSSLARQLIIGWIVGVLFSLIGSYLSFALDFPTGGTVVVVLGVGLFLVALLKGIWLVAGQRGSGEMAP
ncbi:MAG TPA: metal ABC transporter permease [bacterium]|nr:metal ABC transporter permease [bacterium]